MTATNRPYDLRVEHLTNPLGTGADSPRASWKLPDGATSQEAYRVVAGNWDSGRIESRDSLFVPLDVNPASSQRFEWKVQVWTDQGESDWSETAWWEHGLLNPSDLSAWIAPVEADNLPARQRPAYQLASGVRIDGEVASARLYATAHGIYEAFVNGVRVGDLELTPGWTAYRSRLHVQTYDVTDLLTTGDNVVGALLSDGWWRGQNSVSRRVDDYGTTLALLHSSPSPSRPARPSPSAPTTPGGAHRATSKVATSSPARSTTSAVASIGHHGRAGNRSGSRTTVTPSSARRQPHRFHGRRADRRSWSGDRPQR